MWCQSFSPNPTNIECDGLVGVPAGAQGDNFEAESGQGREGCAIRVAKCHKSHRKLGTFDTRVATYFRFDILRLLCQLSRRPLEIWR